MLTRFRAKIISILLKSMAAFLSDPRFFAQLDKRLRDSYYNPATDKSKLESNSSLPYENLGSTVQQDDIQSPLFISARFRTGSTLLWRLLRESGQYTTFYEPLNERRWFDPSARGDRTDPTHVDVSNYWAEYEGLEHLANLYDEKWIRQNLWMDEHSQDNRLYDYIWALIQHSTAIPALQFNRVDFRLAWLRDKFPKANLVHLYRNPRDQWVSTIGKSQLHNEVRLSNFRDFDSYYLSTWCEDLEAKFPEIGRCWEEHPYVAFYILWRLSYHYGCRYSDLSISYEELIEKPSATMTALHTLSQTGSTAFAINLPKKLSTNSINRYKDFGTEEWFQSKESQSERILAQFHSLGTD